MSFSWLIVVKGLKIRVMNVMKLFYDEGGG